MKWALEKSNKRADRYKKKITHDTFHDWKVYQGMISKENIHQHAFSTFAAKNGFSGTAKGFMKIKKINIYIIPSYSWWQYNQKYIYIFGGKKNVSKVMFYFYLKLYELCFEYRSLTINNTASKWKCNSLCNYPCKIYSRYKKMFFLHMKIKNWYNKIN